MLTQRINAEGARMEPMQGLAIIRFTQAQAIHIARHRGRLAIEQDTPQKQDEPLIGHGATKGGAQLAHDLLDALIEFHN